MKLYIRNQPTRPRKHEELFQLRRPLSYSISVTFCRRTQSHHRTLVTYIQPCRYTATHARTRSSIDISPRATTTDDGIMNNMNEVTKATSPVCVPAHNDRGNVRLRGVCHISSHLGSCRMCDCVNKSRLGFSAQFLIITH